MKTNNADKWFSRFIRLRASDDQRTGRCFTCGRIGDVKDMDCGHYIKRQHQGARYSEVNCQIQCKRCNSFEQGADAKFRERLIETYGIERVLLVEASKRQSVPRSKYDLQMIAELYRQQVEKLLKTKGVQKWW